MTGMDPIEIESAADDGLLGLVTRAERAILELTTDPVGLLRIELAHPPPDHPQVAVEASFVERGGSGVVERLDVDVATTLAGDPTREKLCALLSASGGSDFTSLCLRSGERELLDVTLYFASAIKLFGRCTALPSGTLEAKDVETCQHVLSALGIKASGAGGDLAVKARRFGGPPSADDQVEAMLRARKRGADVELYASTLPVTRSVRLALGGPADAVAFLCTVSRQLGREATSIAREAVELKTLVERELGFQFGAHRWRVDNAHGEAPEHRPHGPMGGGQRVQWSLNWGAKRR